MKIRTAILGYGRSGSGLHAGAIAHHADAFEMVAVCDIDPARRQQASGRFGCALYDDYRAMLEREKLDLVCVVTRSDQHCQMTCDCLDAGVNVLVTKPWALNEAEALRMVDAATRAKGRLMPWLPARWGCDLKRLKELVGGGVIGKVFLIRRAVASFATRNDWQTERRYGGGYLLNWGPHIIDPPSQLMDSPVKSVYGRMKQTINPGDVEDLFYAVLNLADGTVVQAEYTVAVEEPPSWFIQGDRGTIVVRGLDIKIYQRTPAQPNDPTAYGTMKAVEDRVLEERLEGDVYGDQKEIYGEIAQALRGGKPYPIKPEDALQLTRVLDAIRTANTENRIVTLP